ncbi:hypothetical protein DYBT9275_04206 [Dyadobacter sp. CECT 9275]|uniref:TraB/GumN family protein n=1 Tax=Dyadobacter helix TaxID=2822344 RepID=A0A916JET9_9BACT|nr:TraB/GumN family protein [Dyadobacter sp. CECT 9275]CAG5008160.1 hypothetical protein DYBT9275_04206 [Dyadobacter sp. CECT 9275]
MKKAFIYCILLCCTSYVCAQAPKEKALLWEVTGMGLQSPSYLFGTIHLICPADFALSDALKNALSRTEQTALEVDMDDPEMMMKMMKTMNMKNGTELKSLMSPEQYSRLSAYYKDSVGIGLAMFEKAKPFVLMGPLFNVVLSCQPQSYEMSLVELAKKQKSEVIGIETLEEQMAIFDTIPYSDQLKQIVVMIDSLPSARKEFKNLVDLYKAQDIDSLYQLTMKSEFGLDGNEEIMLFDRNRKWIPRMDKIMKAKPTFFGVGAAHLGGPTGVIALLRKAGYDVRPVL